MQELARSISWVPNLVRDQELHMFDGKNNRLLDSFAFRIGLTAVVFAVWTGAGYALLSLL